MLLQEAQRLIDHLQQCFQAMPKKGTGDELAFQEVLASTLSLLARQTDCTNTVLIGLEKFYQRSSFLIGLTSLNLDESTYQAFRQYDHFHTATVKPELALYGPTVLF